MIVYNPINALKLIYDDERLREALPYWSSLVKSFGDNGPIMDTGQLGVASMNTDVSRVVQYVNIKRFQKKKHLFGECPKKGSCQKPLVFYGHGDC